MENSLRKHVRSPGHQRYLLTMRYVERYIPAGPTARAITAKIMVALRQDAGYGSGILKYVYEY